MSRWISGDVTTIYQYGDTREVRRDVARLVVQHGSLRSVADLIPHVNAGYLSQVMREIAQPSPALLDWLGFDRVYSVKYVRK